MLKCHSTTNIIHEHNVRLTCADIKKTEYETAFLIKFLALFLITFPTLQ